MHSYGLSTQARKAGPARLSGGLRPPGTTAVKARVAFAPLFGLDSCRVLWPRHNTPPAAPEERRRARFAGLTILRSPLRGT